VGAGIALLAEKVETREDSDQAADLGYAYVQGYFFARPEILVTQQAPALRANRMAILGELRREDPDLPEGRRPVPARSGSLVQAAAAI